MPVPSTTESAWRKPTSNGERPTRCGMLPHAINSQPVLKHLKALLENPKRMRQEFLLHLMLSDLTPLSRQRLTTSLNLEKHSNSSSCSIQWWLVKTETSE